MDKERILQLAHATDVAVLSARRHIHQHPELSCEERETAAFVAERLVALGYEPQTNIAGHGIKAVLHGGRPGRTVGLRADMDALPLREEPGLPFASVHPGVMHACGHDAHTAMLLGAAEALRTIRDELAGSVVFLFQPAEEKPPGGARPMIEAGVLADPAVDCVFGLHQSTAYDVGQFGVSSGPRQASSDHFRMAITGKGGHAANPHVTVDQIAAAATAITGVHRIVSRRLPALHPVVITIGTIHGGTKDNIIPELVTMTGTVRCFDEAIRQEVPLRLREVLDSAAAMFGAVATLDYEFGYPVTSNDADMTVVAQRAAARIVGETNVRRPPRLMGAEDFSYFLQQVPGAFTRIGAGTPGATKRAPGHSPKFVLDEAALPLGVAFYLSLVTDVLGG